ncbi:unnamed protein product [Acanthoscelides obtectus]|uniref:Uncharacterized protein n=1 Tax=Acanthoscelides obtectus TaxID=200917 RepID=A0A9P0LAP6_ACAOB|nr:unnamed protein product [Acanthoscelides obtectus]CAK1680653.1 hypothetical protein AOBTE_LOCUS32824 [Acanthoscelides obtectus]
MSISSSSEFSEEDPYVDSGTDYVLSDSTDSDVPGPSRRRSKHFVSAKKGTHKSNEQQKTSVSNNTEIPNIQTVKKKGKKRVRMESKWKRNIMKSKQARGEEYINSANKLIQKKTTGPNCHCRKRCFTKIDDTQRQNILEQFYSTGDKTKQDIYLGGLISVSNVKRKRPTTGEGREKSNTYQYKLRTGSQETIVCKKAFCSLHGVSKNRVSQIAKNLTLGSIMSPSDKRGKHSNRPNKISEEIIAQIEEHIRSFPRRKSHYSREDNQKRYFLSPELNIATMHRLYLQKYEPEKYALLDDGKILKDIKPVVTYDFYHRQFNLNHNLSFGHPRSDTCQKCDRLHNTISAEANAENKTRLETEKHHYVPPIYKWYYEQIRVTNQDEQQREEELDSDSGEVETEDF